MLESFSVRRRNLIVPREHGAWGILLVPLVTGACKGLFAGGAAVRVAPLALTAVACFWLRTPVENWIGSGLMRARTAAELRLVRMASLALGLVSSGALAWLLWQGPAGPLVGIGFIAVLCFAIQAAVKRFRPEWHAVAQMIGAAGLSATAPAAYCAVAGRTGAAAWALWIANFLFAANQIHYVKTRIRTARLASRGEKLRMGRWFLIGQLALAAILAASWAADLVHPAWALAFAPLLARGFGWFIGEPRPLAIHALGKSELLHACLFALLLAMASRLQ